MSVVGLRTPLARGADPAGVTHMHDSSLNGLIVYAPGLSAPKSTPTRSLASRLSELLAGLLTTPQADLRARARARAATGADVRGRIESLDAARFIAVLGLLIVHTPESSQL